jgi:putative PIN family toxin of toxin-antitoxin system
MLNAPVRLVLDTNIVIDMLHFDDRHTRPLRTAITDGRVRCFTDDDCLAELERVTGYPEFALDAPARAALLAAYLAFVTRCPAEANESDEDAAGYALPRCRDADDQKFLIVAARCQADLLLTRDKLLLRLDRHRRLPPPFGIVTAARACELLGLGKVGQGPVG